MLKRTRRDIMPLTKNLDETATKEVSDTAIDISNNISSKTIEKVKKPSLGRTISARKIFIQYYGKQINEYELALKFKKIWLKDHKLNEIKELKAYYKLEDQKAYYVVNGTTTVIIELF
jgi:hypothetical protein